MTDFQFFLCILIGCFLVMIVTKIVLTRVYFGKKSGGYSIEPLVVKE